MNYEKLELYGTSIHVVRLGQEEITRVHVTNKGFRTVSSIGEELSRIGARLVVNGDGWGLADNQSKPNSIAVSDGNVIQDERYHQRPYFMFSKNAPIEITHDWSADRWRSKIAKSAYNIVSGDRYLVINGVFNAAISDRTKRDARTAIGVDIAGGLVVVVSDGNSKAGIGLTFPELAEVFTERNVVTAINLDGGGSSAMWLDSEVKNQPNDDGQEGERAVVNHLVAWFEGETPEPEPEPDPDPEPEPRKVVSGTLTFDDGSKLEMVPKND